MAQTMTFDKLGLAPQIIEAVRVAGYTEPTPIQAQAIPKILQGRDVVGIAQTGTGKTASFTLPMIHQLLKGHTRARMPRALILEPTRELAHQVSENFDKYNTDSKLTKALLIGGVSYGQQERAIERGADVLIATPGRLIDHAKNGKVLLVGIEILVIDEADRMLDMGFIPDIEKITQMLPSQRQTLLFSATMDKEIDRIAHGFLTNPVRIEADRPASTNHNVQQMQIPVTNADKAEILQKILATETISNAIIFCNRKRLIPRLMRKIENAHYSAVQLHGDMAQTVRLKMLQKFRNNEAQFLIASDVAARGLDIPSVSHVINYDVPTSPQDYVHRIGRTGRAGRNGVAIILVSHEDRPTISAIESLTGQKIELYQPQQASAENVPDTISTITAPMPPNTTRAGIESVAHEQKIDVGTDDNANYRALHRILDTITPALKPIIVLAERGMLKKLVVNLRRHGTTRAFHKNMNSRQIANVKAEIERDEIEFIAATPDAITKFALMAPLVINLETPQDAVDYGVRAAACHANGRIVTFYNDTTQNKILAIEATDHLLTKIDIPETAPNANKAVGISESTSTPAAAVFSESSTKLPVEPIRTKSTEQSPAQENRPPRPAQTLSPTIAPALPTHDSTTQNTPTRERKISFLPGKKQSLLISLVETAMKSQQFRPIIILINTAKNIEKMLSTLSTYGKTCYFTVAMDSEKKQATIEACHAGEIDILIASVSAISKSDLTTPYLINYYVPPSAKSYIINLGLSRADGQVITFYNTANQNAIDAIEARHHPLDEIEQTKNIPRKRNDRKAQSTEAGSSKTHTRTATNDGSNARKSKSAGKQDANGDFDARTTSTPTPQNAKLIDPKTLGKTHFGAKIPAFFLIDYSAKE